MGESSGNFCKEVIILQSMKAWNIILVLITTVVLLCLTGCNHDPDQKKSEDTAVQDITGPAGAPPADKTPTASDDASDQGTNASSGMNEAAVTAPPFEEGESVEHEIPMEITEIDTGEEAPDDSHAPGTGQAAGNEQAAGTGNTTGTGNVTDTGNAAGTGNTAGTDHPANPGNTTTQDTQTPTDPSSSQDGQVTEKGDENELPAIDPFAKKGQ